MARLRRRVLLRAGISGLTVAALLGRVGVSAQVKASQQEAAYQPGPSHGMSCQVCSLFRPPRACVVVAGDISPTGWCRFFALPD